MDMIQDEDHRLDEVNLTGTVTWTPVLPKGLSQAKATGPNRLVSLKPIKSLVSAGQIVSLSGTVSEIGDVPGEVGQELPVMIDDTPVWWRASFDVHYESTAVTIPTMLVDATEGDVDITTLVSAGGFPEVPTGDIESVIATVRSMSRATEDAIRRAETAADAVGEVDAAAREAVRVAGESASAAESSAAASEASAVRAEAGAARVGSAEAVLEARDQATAAATTATGAASTATEQADRAKSEADRAGSEADRASEQASAASSSATDAHASASTATQKATQATSAAASALTNMGYAQSSASNALASQNAAYEHRNAAQTAASTATTEADRATTEADRAQTAADSVDTDVIRQEVTDQIAAVVDGAPADLDTIREVAEYAQENRDITDTLNAAIGQKADKAHTHAVADVTGLQAALDGKAASSHTHTTSQVTGLDTALGAKLDASKIQVVTAMPSTPVAGTIYLVTGV
ncbi:MAG: hypothetical protein ACTH0J_10555 [Corynebacterium variabile]|uniref:hypothetical protein n=1 Tax=Corynebacterium variabile TaxID=1727 RepID=UPI003F8E23CE